MRFSVYKSGTLASEMCWVSCSARGRFPIGLIPGNVRARPAVCARHVVLLSLCGAQSADPDVVAYRDDRMNWGKLVAFFENGACTTVIGLMLIAFPSSTVNAEQPPRKGCVAVSKGEYRSAKRENLLRNRQGTYVRTGRLWRRHYWYCRW
jgi:hypothetical protein